MKKLKAQLETKELREQELRERLNALELIEQELRARLLKEIARTTEWENLPASQQKLVKSKKKLPQQKSQGSLLPNKPALKQPICPLIPPFEDNQNSNPQTYDDNPVNTPKYSPNCNMLFQHAQ